MSFHDLLFKGSRKSWSFYRSTTSTLTAPGSTYTTSMTETDSPSVNLQDIALDESGIAGSGDDVPLVTRVTEEESKNGTLRNFVLSHSFVSSSVYKFRRFPRGVGVWLVFLLFFLFGVAEFSITLILFLTLNAYHEINPPETVAAYLAARCVAFTLYPVMGFLADTYFGRYKVLLVSLHIAWIGSVVMSLSFAFIDPYLSSDPLKYTFGSNTSWPKDRIVALSLCYGAIWAGFTGIRVNLIPFGVDQLPDASGGELSSYFHWYYWFINVGYFVATMVAPKLYTLTALSYAFLITSFCFTCMIIILILLRSKFTVMPKIGNPFKLVYQVVRYAMKTKRPTYTSAFQLGQARPSRLDYAMLNHGGSFTVEQVEDVKVFFRILVILVSFFGYFAIFSQMQSTYLFESMRLQTPDGYHRDCPEQIVPKVNRTIECQFWTFSPSVWLAYANIVPVLVLLPLLDRVIYPCVIGHAPSMLRRITLGKVFLLLSICVAIGVEIYRIDATAHMLKDEGDTVVINAIPFHTGSSTILIVASPMTIYSIIPQYLLFAFADVFSIVTAVEFIYAQSPAHMKGILLGLLFETEGIAMGFVAMLIWLLEAFPEFSFFSFFGNSNLYYTHVAHYECTNGSIAATCSDSAIFSYILFLLVATVSVIIFMIAAIRYKLRTRDPEPALQWLYGAGIEYNTCSCCNS